MTTQSAESAPELLPCPFCGFEDIELVGTRYGLYWAQCGDCGSRTDSVGIFDRADAVSFWNGRVKPSRTRPAQPTSAVFGVDYSTGEDCTAEVRGELKSDGSIEINQIKFHPPAREALNQLVSIIDAAGLQNLMNGVQLGQTSWYLKASDAMNAARSALSQPTSADAMRVLSWAADQAQEDLMTAQALHANQMCGPDEVRNAEEWLAICRRAALSPPAADAMREALQCLYDDIADYIRTNNLGGMNNYAMKLARAALSQPPAQEVPK